MAEITHQKNPGAGITSVKDTRFKSEDMEQLHIQINKDLIPWVTTRILNIVSP